MQYAKDTSVSSEQSQAEIRKTLTRYGATKFAYMEEEERAAIMFEISNRRIRFVLPLPNRNDPKFWVTPDRKIKRKPDAAFKEWEQASRQRWRALALAIKAKLEAVESGIATFEEEFLAYVVMPDGQTVGAHVLPKVEEAYLTNQMPPLLPAIGGTREGKRANRFGNSAQTSNSAISSGQSRWPQVSSRF